MKRTILTIAFAIYLSGIPFFILTSAEQFPVWAQTAIPLVYTGTILAVAVWMFWKLLGLFRF